MTTKPKTRKAPAAKGDPIFELIAEHKALSEKVNLLRLMVVKLSETKPTTLAGIAALVDYARLAPGANWSWGAFKTVVAALKEKGARR